MLTSIKYAFYEYVCVLIMCVLVGACSHLRRCTYVDLLCS